MNKFLLKHSEDKVYIIEKENFSLSSIEKKIREKGYEVIKPANVDHFLTQLDKENEKGKGLNELIVITENQPFPDIREHFNYLNLTVEWLLTILHKFSIGLCIFDNEHFLAYNKVFKNITNLTYEEIKIAKIDTFVNDIARKNYKSKIKKCLNKEINSFTQDFEMKHNKIGEKHFKMHGFSLTIEGKKLGAGYLLNEKNHDFSNQETLRINKLIINELHQAFKLLSKIQGLDKISSDSKEEIINELAEQKPDYGRLQLSDREYEVLMFIYKGYTNQQIADELYISKRTVDFHRSNLLGKTNSRNTADLIRFALQNQLILE